MRKYTVIAVLGFPAGVVLGLSEEQAARRQHALTPVAKGVYETTAPVQFKVGETIATDAEVNKAMATSLEPEETTKAKARDKARAEADAKNLALLKEKAAKWDEFEAQIAEAQAKCVAFDSLPEDVRSAALAKTAAAKK